jgi:hypothetical protein
MQGSWEITKNVMENSYKDLSVEGFSPIRLEIQWRRKEQEKQTYARMNSYVLFFYNYVEVS